MVCGTYLLAWVESEASVLARSSTAGRSSPVVANPFALWEQAKNTPSLKVKAQIASQKLLVWKRPSLIILLGSTCKINEPSQKIQAQKSERHSLQHLLKEQDDTDNGNFVIFKELRRDFQRTTVLYSGSCQNPYTRTRSD